jgi:hypothetical protein|tara:strand:+ start:366 stop:590 length:225 start_codon:yes stop_codon:yes gene_type:complete
MTTTPMIQAVAAAPDHVQLCAAYLAAIPACCDAESLRELVEAFNQSTVRLGESLDFARTQRALMDMHLANSAPQ